MKINNPNKYKLLFNKIKSESDFSLFYKSYKCNDGSIRSFVFDSENEIQTTQFIKELINNNYFKEFYYN